MILVGILLSALVNVIGSFARPFMITCPHGWWIDGVRPSGASACLYTPGREDWPAITDRPVIAIDVRIYCVAGERPLVIDERSIACVRKRIL